MFDRVCTRVGFELATLAPAKPRRRQRRLGSAMDYLLQTTPAAKISSVRRHEMARREEETAPKDRDTRETAWEEGIRAMRTARNFTRIEGVFPKCQNIRRMDYELLERVFSNLAKKQGLGGH